MKNRLDAGDVRIGWLVDGDERTPERSVVLRNTGSAIELELPTRGMFDPEDRYMRWFQSGVDFADDPDRTRFDYSPPETLLFHDADGSVVLVGCRDAGATLGFNAGNGRISALGAVLGGTNLAFREVNGVRTEIPGLSTWTRVSSLRTSAEHADDGAVERFHITLESGQDIRLNRRKNLLLRPSWRSFPGEDVGHLLSVDAVRLETMLDRPAPIDEHLSEHEAVRELLMIAAGRNFGYRGLEVCRYDDPERSLAGPTGRQQWSPFVTHARERHEPWQREPDYLFRLADVGPTGVRKWFRLRDKFKRGIRPAVSLIAASDQLLEHQMFTVGVAIESIGYQLARADDDRDLNARGQLSFPKAVDLLVNDIGWEPLNDVEQWSRDVTACYRGVKHPDHPLPDIHKLHSTVRAGRVMLRIWVARQLGCRQSQLLQQLRRDSANHDLVPDAT